RRNRSSHYDETDRYVLRSNVSGVETMIWLGIETSNVPLSIAVMNGDEVLAEEVMTTKVNHSVRAMSAVERVMAAAEVKPSDLDAIAVTEGPGSYTGVRIGVTIAKTLAWTLHVPLV